MNTLRRFAIAIAALALIPAQAQESSSGGIQFYPSGTITSGTITSITTQVPQLSVLVTPYVLPCGQGSTLLGLFSCPPESHQGIFVHVRKESSPYVVEINAVSYAVTVRYRTAAGESKTATETVSRRPEGWTTVAFAIGRVKTTNLPDGVIVDGVDVIEQPPPVSIAIGENYFESSASSLGSKNKLLKGGVLANVPSFDDRCIVQSSYPSITTCYPEIVSK